MYLCIYSDNTTPHHVVDVNHVDNFNAYFTPVIYDLEAVVYCSEIAE